MFKLLFYINILNSWQSLLAVSRLITIVLTINKNSTKRKILNYMATFSLRFWCPFQPWHDKSFKLFIKTFNNVFSILGPKLFLWTNWNSHLMIRSGKFCCNLTFVLRKQWIRNRCTEIRLCLIIIKCCLLYPLLQTFTVIPHTFFLLFLIS